MVDKNASMYLGSPRMAEKVIGEKVSLEEMGGARMHCSVSGCGDMLVTNEQEGIEAAKKYLTYFPANFKEKSKVVEGIEPKFGRTVEEIVPKHQNAPFDMYECIEALIDENSFFEIKKLFAPEIITGLARMDGKVVGIIANQPKIKVEFYLLIPPIRRQSLIQLCDAFHIPLLFLADVSRFYDWN